MGRIPTRPGPVVGGSVATVVGLTVGLWLVCPMARAQPFGGVEWELSPSVYVDQLDSAARTQLELARNYLAEQQWTEALDVLTDLGQTQAARLVELGPGRYVSAREFCQRVFAQLGPQPLAQYRARVDAEAGRWYELGRDGHREDLLERVLSEAYASSWGDDALWLLGELALEKGDVALARSRWEQLIPSPPESPAALPSPAADSGDGAGARPIAEGEAGDGKRPPGPGLELPLRKFYPDTALDLADVRARLVWVSILTGDVPRAERELAAFAQLHPGATGRMAGRTGVYTDLLAALLEQSRAWPALAAQAPAAADRSARKRPLDLGSLAWRVALERAPVADPLAVRAFGYRPRRVGEEPDLCLSYHPLVRGENVFLAMPSGIWAFDLATGKPAWGKNPVFADSEGSAFFGRRGTRGCIDPPRYTLETSGDRLLARLGSPVTVWSSDFAFQRVPGYLAGLDLSRQGSTLWDPIRPPPEGWAFEGPPVCDSDRLYVALRRSEVRPQAHVACYDLATGRQRWSRLVCAAQTPTGDLVDQCTHNQLTLAGETLYFNTNLGAVAAINTADGAIGWLTTYRRSSGNDISRPAAHWYRDLNPCLLTEGRVIVAPSDSPAILALDAATGQILWEARYAEDVVHLLGIEAGQLIASGDRLWWIDLATGRPRRHWPDGPSPLGRGRGTVAGQFVYWPTRESIYVFDAVQGNLVRTLPLLARFPDLPGGNLVVAGSLMLMATASKQAGHQLVAFSPLSAVRPETAEPIVQMRRETAPRPAFASTSLRAGPRPAKAAQ